MGETNDVIFDLENRKHRFHPPWMRYPLFSIEPPVGLARVPRLPGHNFPEFGLMVNAINIIHQCKAWPFGFNVSSLVAASRG